PIRPRAYLPAEYRRRFADLTITRSATQHFETLGAYHLRCPLARVVGTRCRRARSTRHARDKASLPPRWDPPRSVPLALTTKRTSWRKNSTSYEVTLDLTTCLQRLVRPSISR